MHRGITLGTTNRRFVDRLGSRLPGQLRRLGCNPALFVACAGSRPSLLNYIIAVDQFVHNQFSYGVCERPNTAVDLLKFTKGRCGEYAKLKQSLLRSAGIPTTEPIDEVLAARFICMRVSRARR
ncbi:MAG: transglutaminase domain-containing protein [Planctomycetes bacterium]|nr:transglutaminase domain-containing protein [Planctomycetota bacterium]